MKLRYSCIVEAIWACDLFWTSGGGSLCELAAETSSAALVAAGTGLLGCTFAYLANLSVFKFCYITFLCCNTFSLAKYSDLNLFDCSIL